MNMSRSAHFNMMKYINILTEVKKLSAKLADMYPSWYQKEYIEVPTSCHEYVEDRGVKFMLHMLIDCSYQNMLLTKRLYQTKELQEIIRCAGKLHFEELTVYLTESDDFDEGSYVRLFWCNVKTNTEYSHTGILDIFDGERPGEIEYQGHTILEDVFEGMEVEIDVYYHKIPTVSTGQEPSPVAIDYVVEDGEQKESVLIMMHNRREKIGSVKFRVLNPVLGKIELIHENEGISTTSDYVASINPYEDLKLRYEEIPLPPSSDEWD